jgi:hypothetical protein
MVSAVAPHKPRLFILSSGVSTLPLAIGTRQGPIAQLLQQLPSDPMGHGAIFSALSNTVFTWSFAAFSIISSVAGSLLLVFGSATFFLLVH